ncbi:MAG: hypothetical protein COU22_03540 [Candidatus Komeilibacteria bacterium CG10_big_fil_rev_8_21_14_0_10_41_13]|uniref:Phosphoribosyl-ATP pyrophosphohydrolase n=1 Tax=Candidatus Komeilibacteria bacterium CG10_big_fil_rev_8_21_14_0_10_41_13 TaxID=1974476 RepID=A0A2M6WBL1_9BACT|nr:MAG: hypothetical protein COU22_03540 [Candidatus Komeilibacteria bacterium CG10_big_fil_rev_8_21_14_0_10_41_13]
MQYNKLIRDKIPEIIKAKGKIASTHIANDSEYSEKLRDKLGEEIREFLESNEIEELADILEVIYALAEHLNITPEELEKIRAKKAEERGVFKEKIILEEIIE